MKLSARHISVDTTRRQNTSRCNREIQKHIIVQIGRRPGRRFVSEILEIRRYNMGRDEYDTIPLYAR